MKTRWSFFVLIACLALVPVFAVRAQGSRSPSSQAMAGRPEPQAASNQGAVDLPRTGQITGYAPGDDGALQMGMEWPIPRFVDSQDGTITDLLTGLMWTKNANLFGAGMNWQNALSYVAAMNRGEHENFGHKDWRMPNIVEIESLINYGQSNPATSLKDQGFTNVPEASGWQNLYWSSSGGAGYAKVVWFYDGHMIATLMDYTGLLWPVCSDREGTIRLPKTGSHSSVAPGDDGDLQVGASWPDPRFIKIGGGTVNDNLTGLMWAQNANLPSGKITWQQALDFIVSLNNSNYLGYQDWRLPNLRELRSLNLFERYFTNSLFINVPPDQNGPSYWTSTTYASTPTSAWAAWLVWGNELTFMDKNSLMYILPVRSGELPPGVVTHSQVTTSKEKLFSQQSVLIDTAVTGALSGTMGFPSFETVLLSTGSFTGKGFFKGQYAAMLDGVSYAGNWQGAINFNQADRKLNLYGSAAGEISAVVEGVLTETIPGSELYDHYEATWKIGKLGNKATSASLNVSGNLTMQGGTEYPNTEVEVLQAGIEGVLYGHYEGPISVVMTLLQVTDPTNPYHGNGFSYLTYNATTGSGESWSYASIHSPGETHIEGLMWLPYFGILHGVLDETHSPATLSFYIERVDLGVPPAAYLSINTWGSVRASSGQNINYVLEYRNQGVKPADDVIVCAFLDPPAEIVSASPGSQYDDTFHTISWDVGPLPPGARGELSIQAYIPWGMAQGAEIGVSAYIVNVENSSTVTASSSVPTNLLLNGIGLNLKTFGGRKYTEFSERQSASWPPIYHSGRAYDILDVIGATPSNILADADGLDPSENNGLTNPLVTNASYDTCYSYSGGTRTVVTAIRLYNLRCKKLVMISPMAGGLQVPGTYKQELVDLLQNKGVEKIDIYQSDKDLLPFSGLYQAKFDPNDSWLAGKNITINPVNLDGPAGIDAHWKLFWKVNQLFNGSVTASARGLSTIAVAHDPNAKYGPEGGVHPEDVLSYTVEFENEGEGIAFGVYFVDTLDEALDAATLQIGPVLNTGGQQIAGPGIFDPATRTITWFVGEVGPGQGGHAAVQVCIRPDSPPGKEIINYATVYFPSVPEITLTNGVVTRVGMDVYLPVIRK